jgi:hypothetical protein
VRLRLGLSLDARMPPPFIAEGGHVQKDSEPRHVGSET